MHHNAKRTLLKEIVKESGKAAVVSAAATFGSFVGLIAVGLIINKYQDIKEARQAKR